MLLIHLFIALINYKGDTIQKIDAISDQIKYDKNNLVNIKSLFNNYNNNSLSNSIIIDNNDLLELLIFQQYFLDLLFSHFTNVYNIIFKRESMNLGGIKLKNLYIIDYSTKSIIFDLKETQNRKNNFKYYRNDLLMNEILYQSNIIYQYYLNSYKNNNNKTKIKYLLFECTSTFPRLLFIFKFIPVLKGLITIHVYYQKKLSRKKINSYHEINLTYCSPERQNKNSHEFQYCEPKKIIIINKFLEEFYLTSRKSDLFRIISNNKKFKYFNYLAVNAINSITIKDSMNNDIDTIFNIINEKIQEQIQEKKNNKITIKSDENSFDKILDIDINNIYKELYIDNENYIKKENNEKIYDLPNIESSDINIRDKKDNQSENNYVLSKRNITIVFDNNLSDTKTKYNNNFNDIKINNINNKESKNQIIDKGMSDSINLTNVDFMTKIYDKSSINGQDNFSLISEVEKASNNNLKEIEIHKNNNKYLSGKKKVKSNINILDLLDISNIKSLNKNSGNKIIQESEENRLNDLSENNPEHLSESKIKLNKQKIPLNQKLRAKLPILDKDKIRIKSPLKNNPLN